MNEPKMLSPISVNADTNALVSYFPIPGLGILPINAFLIHSKEPLLVDTGIPALRDDFLRALRAQIDLKDLRWIWLTHIDTDHVGNLAAILREAPQAQVITTFLGAGKLGLLQIAIDRMYLLNPGQRLNIGDRELVALHPPVFDAPETTGFFDTRRRALFSSDCFGALLQQPEEDAAHIPYDALRNGMITWATIDAPWLTLVKPDSFETQLNEICKLEPEGVFSSHLPPAKGIHNRLCKHLSEARTAPAFVGPDQKALLEMMAAAS